MRRLMSVLMTAVLLVSTVGLVPAGFALPVDDARVDVSQTNAQEANQTGNATDIPPGARLSAVLNVQEAELEGEVETRAFGIKVARAATQNATASVVAEELTRIETRLQSLEREKQALSEARENGSIGEGQYQAKMAAIAAQTATVKRLANQSAATAEGLPVDLLESKGVNTTAIRTLADRADELAGPDVAAIARSIAGPSIGQQIAADRGPGGAAEGEAAAERSIDRAERRVEAARDRIDRAEDRLGDNASENATSALEDAKDALAEAESALADARDAFESGEFDTAVDNAEAAADSAAAASDHADDALEAAERSGRDAGDGSGTDDEAGTDDGDAGAGQTETPRGGQ